MENKVIVTVLLDDKELSLDISNRTEANKVEDLVDDYCLHCAIGNDDTCERCVVRNLYDYVQDIYGFGVVSPR